MLQWSARRCDRRQEEVLVSVTSVQLQSNVDGVTGNLAKSRAAKRKLPGDLKKKSEGRNWPTQCPSGQHQQES